MKWVFVGRDIQLMKDYTTDNAIFKQGSIGTVIDATSRKDRKWKVKFNNMIQKNTDWLKDVIYLFTSIIAFLPNSESQTEEDSFEY